MNNTLFGNDIPKNNAPIEDVDITTTILYMSTKELQEFKKLCKIGIKDKFGDSFQTKGNIADLILSLLKEKYDL